MKYGALLFLLSAAVGHADAFRAGPGIQALDDRATGVYALGWVSFGGSAIQLQALLQNGEVLQVQGRRGSTWLAKRSGSHGGKPLPPTRFDELAAISGLNTDIRHAAISIQQQFSRSAGIEPPAAPPPSAQANAGCAITPCRTLHEQFATPSGGFRINVSDDRNVWSFEGFGIVAIWAVPAD